MISGSAENCNSESVIIVSHMQVPLGKGRTLLKRGERSWEGYRKQRTHGFLLAEWVSEWMKSFSPVCLFVTPWTVGAYHAPLSMGFSRQEYWNGLPFLSPRIFPTQGSNPGLLHCRQTLYRLSHQGSIGWVLTGKEEDSSFCCALQWLQGKGLPLLISRLYLIEVSVY